MWPKPITSIFLFLVLFSFCGNLAARQSYGDSLSRLLRSTGSAREKALYLKLLGTHLLNNDPHRAENYYRQGLAVSFRPVAKQAEYRAEMAAGMSRIYAMKEDFTASEQWMEQSFAYARSSGDPRTLAFIAGTAVSCYTQMERYDKAVACAELIVRINDSLGNPGGSIEAYNNLGYIYNRLPQFRKALRYYLKSREMQLANKEYDAMQAINTNSGLAFSYYELKQYDSSYYYARLMYSDALKEDAADIISSSLLQQAGALIRMKKYQEAVDAAEKGLRITIDQDITYLQSGFYAVLAWGYAHLGKTEMAHRYVDKSARYLDTTRESLGERIDVYNIYADVFEAEGNFRDAYRYKKMAYEGYEQVKDDEITAQATYSEALLHTEQKQRQIEVLHALNRKQRTVQLLTAGGLLLALFAAAMTWRSYRSKKKLAALLGKSNAEKEVFLKEIHHRVKNNMQIIISLLHMQFRDHKDAAVAAGLKQAQQRIKSMALVHNKLYESEEVVHIYLKGYIQDLSEAILSANNPEAKNIAVTVSEREPVSLSLDTAISVGLMLNELITNACKYAFHERSGGHIGITIGKKDEGYELQVRDDGNGLPDQFDRKGSLGVRLIRNLATQLGGRAEFNSGSGTSVHIFFTENAAA